MKILITNVYNTKNKGDAAIVSVMIKELKKIFKEAEVSISTIEATSDESSFENTKVLTSFFHEAIYTDNRLIFRIVKTFYYLIFSILWVAIYRLTRIKLQIFSVKILKLLNEYTDSDLIIAAGGGYLLGRNNIHGTITIILHLHSFVITKLLGKKQVLFTQTVGPFENYFQFFVAKLVLRKVDFIIVREKISEKLLKKMQIDENRYSICPDIAFLFKCNSSTDIRYIFNDIKIDDRKLLIGLTVKQCLLDDQQTKYEKAIAGLINYILKEHKAKIVFIPQVTAFEHNDDDRIVANRIKHYINDNIDVHFIDKELSHHEVKLLYSKLDFLIATRMHSAIFALTSFIPIIAIAYEYKTIGVMEDLGLKNWVIEIKEVNESRLIDLFKNLVHKKKEFTEYLKLNIPTHQSKAEMALKVVKEVVLNK